MFSNITLLTDTDKERKDDFFFLLLYKRGELAKGNNQQTRKAHLGARARTGLIKS